MVERVFGIRFDGSKAQVLCSVPGDACQLPVSQGLGWHCELLCLLVSGCELVNGKEKVESRDQASKAGALHSEGHTGESTDSPQPGGQGFSSAGFTKVPKAASSFQAAKSAEETLGNKEAGSVAFQNVH